MTTPLVVFRQITNAKYGVNMSHIWSSINSKYM